jgi:hypothetical protein
MHPQIIQYKKHLFLSRVRKGAGRALEWKEDSTSNVRIAKKKP